MAGINELLNSIQSYSDTVKEQAADAAEKLESLATLPFQTWVGFAPRATVDLQRAQRVTGESLPVLGRATLDFTADAFNPDSYKQPTYVSSFFTFLQPILQNQIASGGPGISQGVQDALFGAMYERDRQTLRDSLEDAESNVGRRGFPMPTGMSQAARDSVIARYQDTRDQRSRDIAVLLAERAQQNMQVAISAGNNMEQIQSSFSLGFAKLFQDHTNQLLLKYKTEQETLVAEFDGKVRAILAETEIAKINGTLELGYQDQLIKKWQVEVDAAIEQTKALIQQGMSATQVKLTAATALSDFYRTIVAASLDQINGIIAQTTVEESE